MPSKAVAKMEANTMEKRDIDD
ncbi:uncharacterized protein ARMOST_19582 [Armillaria ostoyae]|uniref:Uncharacterized protein n=1 Tax=Armillaria ostoyae TaxID=47428 RepID=A0A284S539_ARMOS|nr:uncharacterized protein ARMOST_19582 [Armillaria ostoyae]